MKSKYSFLLPLGAGAGLIGLWYLIIYSFKIPSFVLPRPDQILITSWTERKALLTSAWITGQGAFLGFICAVIGGFLLSFLMAFSFRLKKSFYPYILILQMTPVIILAPIFVLWLRQGLPTVSYTHLTLPTKRIV